MMRTMLFAFLLVFALPRLSDANAVFKKPVKIADASASADAADPEQDGKLQEGPAGDASGAASAPVSTDTFRADPVCPPRKHRCLINGHHKCVPYQRPCPPHPH